MKASKNQLDDLLQLGGLDQATRVSIKEANNIIAQLRALDASQELVAASTQLLECTNALDNLTSELARIDADLKVVEARIAKDRDRLETTSSTKDISGLQSELGLLAKRKSELEDSELELMDQISGAESNVKLAKAERMSVEEKNSAKREIHKAELLKLQNAINDLKSKRQALQAQIPDDLVVLYDQKSARGVAIGRLNGRECGACRMALTAANYDELTHAPGDEVVFCPECQAILVR